MFYFFMCPISFYNEPQKGKSTVEGMERYGLCGATAWRHYASGNRPMW